MRESIKRHFTEVYRRATRDTFTGTVAMIMVIQFAVIGVGCLLVGILSGASTALDGGSVAPLVSEVAAIETEVWSDLGTDSSAVGRLVYGLMHWIVVFAVWLAVAGIRVGYAIPATGHVVKYLGEPLVWGLWLLLFLQLVRAIELAYREWGVEG